MEKSSESTPSGNVASISMATPSTIPISLSEGPPPNITRNSRPGGRKQKSISGSGESEQAARAGRKDRDPNWNRSEMLALVQAKCKEFLDELEAEDPHTLMTSEGTRWDKVATSVNLADGVLCYRSPDACKYKWQVLLLDYKKIGNAHKQTGTNSEFYFSLSVTERRSRGLPPNFDPLVYHELHEWMKHRPTMTLPYLRDLLHPQDRPRSTNKSIDVEDQSINNANAQDTQFNVYSSAAAYDFVADSENILKQNPIEPQSQELPVQSPTGPRQAGLVGDSSHVREGGNADGGIATHFGGGNVQSASPTFHPREGNANNPQVISSSDASISQSRKVAPDSTGVRRKTNVAINSVAEATLEVSEKLVASIKEMNANAKLTQEKMLEMELRIHEENMKYRYQKDKRVQELARQALLNQSTIAAAMLTMAEALKGVQDSPTIPPEVPTPSEQVSP